MTCARQGVYMDPASGQLMARAQAAAQQPGMRTPGGVPYPDHASRAVELQTLAEVCPLIPSVRYCCAIKAVAATHWPRNVWATALLGQGLPTAGLQPRRLYCVETKGALQSMLSMITLRPDGSVKPACGCHLRVRVTPFGSASNVRETGSAMLNLS